jgi:hypothetical protein
LVPSSPHSAKEVNYRKKCFFDIIISLDVYCQASFKMEQEVLGRMYDANFPSNTDKLFKLCTGANSNYRILWSVLLQKVTLIKVAYFPITYYHT